MPGEITVGAQGKHVQQYGVAAHETFINKLVFIATVCVGSAVHSHVEQCGGDCGVGSSCAAAAAS